MRRSPVLVWLSTLLILDCTEAERAPRASDLELATQDPMAAFVDSDDPLHPDTQSPCGAATVALEFLRPNLYFAIDASGSMSDPIPLGQAPTPDPDLVIPPSQRYGALALAILTMLQRVGHRVKYGATLFPTGDTACDAGEEVLPLTNGDTVSFAVSGEAGPVLDYLMRSIYRRTPGGGTPVGAALRGLRAELSQLTTETYVFLLTDGGPNCNPQANCGPDTCIPNIEGSPLSESLDCEAPLNCCDGLYFGPDNCLDDGGSLEAVQQLAELGVKTYVIGIPGSEVYANLLSRLAIAGGTARDGEIAYYGVADADALIETVRTLGLSISLSCTIELAEPPPDRTLVNVFFDGQVVPADDRDGWTWVGEQTVQMRGEACRLMETGEVLQADIVAGCPVIIR